jgi:hypothetical protein
MHELDNLFFVQAALSRISLPGGPLNLTLQARPGTGGIVPGLDKTCMAGMPQGVPPVAVLSRMHRLLGFFLSRAGVRLDLRKPAGGKLSLPGEDIRARTDTR